MNSLIILFGSFLILGLGYRFYGTFIADKLFGLDENKKTPAHEFNDGVDYVPTKKSVLFGHHFTSIAGAGPIVGPAIAVIWGWVPALIWILAGSIFMGAVHDFSALFISMRNAGKTVGDYTKKIIGERARLIFLLILFFALLIVIAVFALVMAVLFSKYPESVFPIWFEIPIAMTMGYLVYKKKMNVAVLSVIALLLMYISIYAGTMIPFKMPGLIVNPVITWAVVLMVYVFFASTLPVWSLLQPRDYINSHELFAGLGIMIIGFLVGAPKIVAPALNLNPEGAPPIAPFLFITVACGAISGFHSIVSSGTSSKQINNEKDAKLVGYGSMIFEGVLAVMAILACTAGFASTEAWNKHYISWSASSGLGAKVGAFIEGGASFMTHIGISHEIGVAIIAVLVISFAGTTLDTATRLQRYVVTELSEAMNIKFLAGRYQATLFAIVTAFLLCSINGGKGGLILWPLFGTVNQLLGGLALLVASVYLWRKGKNMSYTLVPMLILITFTSWALVSNLMDFILKENWLLFSLGSLILLLEIWMIAEAILVFQKEKVEAIPQTE